jgi:hypothetical protein
MEAKECFFVRSADEEPICGLHKAQLSIESEHGNLDPKDGLLRGRCPVSGALLFEKEPSAQERAV